MTKEKQKIKYESKNPIEHMLLRPDMYIGSVEKASSEQYVASENYKITKKLVDVPPGILRIFIEILSNAMDNLARSKKADVKMTYIRVNIDEKTGETIVENDGQVIPIEMHPTEKCYNHSLIFGRLLTGSNYDDEDERTDISGRNGVGGKAANVFSQKFTVEGTDSGEKLVQTWTENMTKTDGPKITKIKTKKGYTKVTYFPDFPRFELEGYTSDIIAIYKKYLVDAAMITQINVYFNDDLIPVKNLLEYAKLYTDNEDAQYLPIKGPGYNVVVTTSKEFEAISFANGILTSEGGTHVNAWSEALFRPIIEKFNTKKNVVNIRDIKQFFRLFITVSVSQPKFETQSKNKLTGPQIKAEVKKTHISAIMKWHVIENLKDLIKFKEMGELKKVEKKRREYVKGLDPANKQGAPTGYQCTLILVEGLSAKTYASYGIKNGAFGKEGKDWFGIYAMKGKILNTRNAQMNTISKNQVVGDIIGSLAVKVGVDYTDEKEYKKLAYGRVLILTDADVDGIHISGLLQNLFHSLYPSLLKRKKPFLTAMQTPIVRVFLSKNNNILFYDENEYRKYVKKFYKENPGKEIHKKYYKGLGTSNKEDVEESFGVKLIQFHADENLMENMTKAFHKSSTDLRKKWLETYDPKNTVLKWNGNDREIFDMKMSDFINTELIKFSIDDCCRSIPNIMDGLKQGHRKVLYTTFKIKLHNNKKVVKVAQLSGAVSQKSAYHHGEQNLNLTITHMAQAFVGSNNIPLLIRDGMFGSRLEGGKDASDARYIWTKLDVLTRLIFRPEDDVLLDYIEEDGEKIEPYFYVPIIPMVLVNGVICGIGTGWSSNIPCYNPKDIIECIKIWLENDGKAYTKEEDVTITLFPELIPWYRGFKGKIEKTEDSKFITYGVLEEKSECYKITELPIGVWTQNYKEQLLQWEYEKKISIEDNSGPDIIDFTLEEGKNGMNMDLDTLKLSSIVRTSNMCLFTDECKLKKFTSPDEIIDNFCRVRYDYYIRRKKYQIGALEHDIKFLGNKKRFLMEVRDKKIVFSKELKGKNKFRKTEELVQELEERGYDLETKYGVNLEDEEKEENEDKEEEEENEELRRKKIGYAYLLKMQFNSITDERIKKLQKDIDSKIEQLDLLRKTSEKQIWLKDLEEFEAAYDKWLVYIAKETTPTKKGKKTKK